MREGVIQRTEALVGTHDDDIRRLDGGSRRRSSCGQYGVLTMTPGALPQIPGIGILIWTSKAGSAMATAADTGLNRAEQAIHRPHGGFRSRKIYPTGSTC